MKFVLFAALLSTTILAAHAQEAASQKPVCYPRAEITARMMTAGSSPVVVAEIDSATLYEIWSRSAGWTAFITDRSGMMCPVAHGVGPVHTAQQICIDPARCPRI